MLKVTQAPTECRLPDIESLCRPPKAFVLSCDNSPTQRSKFNAHRVFHVSMRSWPLADKFVFRGVGNQPWQPYCGEEQQYVQEAEHAKRFGERV